MREVTKDEFRSAYDRLGGGAAAGWGPSAWQFDGPGMRYLLEEPESVLHTRMMVVTDFAAREYRLFFLTEEGEERLFSFPG
ncbi:MAG: hypothetical protein L6Q95_00690 [Planctomycetes bacterium]|nr:hypothetical protein [Planctomycetota bacterium]